MPLSENKGTFSNVVAIAATRFTFIPITVTEMVFWVQELSALTRIQAVNIVDTTGGDTDEEAGLFLGAPGTKLDDDNANSSNNDLKVGLIGGCVAGT
eukprot:616156-Rhodomonas_salina.2